MNINFEVVPPHAPPGNYFDGQGIYHRTSSTCSRLLVYFLPPESRTKGLHGERRDTDKQRDGRGKVSTRDVI